MQIIEYQADQFDQLVALHQSQDVNTMFLDPATLPKIGFIAAEGSIPVAMGFLRQLEGGYAQIDTLVSNADLPGELRHEGLDKIVSSIIDTAKQLKLKGIISFTSDKSVIMRAVATGFRVSNHAVIVLEL